MGVDDRIELARGARSVSYDLTASGARIIDVSYPAGAEFDTHSHEEAYLCLSTEGSYAEWTDRGGRREVGSGTPLVYAAGSAHAVRTGSTPVRIVHLSDPEHRDWAGAHPFALGLLWQIAAALDGDEDDATELHLEALVCELVDGCGPRPAGRTPGLGRIRRDRSTDWLATLRDRLRDGHRESISLAALAEELGRHPAHVARAFRARWGVTPGEYLRRVRTSSAVTALSETDAPASAVAFDAGFADQSHMGRWMRRYTGRTPGEIRGVGPPRS